MLSTLVSQLVGIFSARLRNAHHAVEQYLDLFERFLRHLQRHFQGRAPDHPGTKDSDVAALDEKRNAVLIESMADRLGLEAVVEAGDLNEFHGNSVAEQRSEWRCPRGGILHIDPAPRNG